MSDTIKSEILKAFLGEEVKVDIYSRDSSHKAFNGYLDQVSEHLFQVSSKTEDEQFRIHHHRRCRFTLDSVISVQVKEEPGQGELIGQTVQNLYISVDWKYEHDTGLFDSISE